METGGGQRAELIARELPTDRVPQLRLLRVRLGRAMKARGYTEYGLAKAIGCSRSSINHYLCGKRLPSSESMVQLSKTLSVSTDWLLGFVCHADGRAPGSPAPDVGPARPAPARRPDASDAFARHVMPLAAGDGASSCAESVDGWRSRLRAARAAAYEGERSL